MNNEIEEETWVAVAIWADGIWCRVEDIWKYQYKPDDYDVLRLYVMDENGIESAVQWYLDSL